MKTWKEYQKMDSFKQKFHDYPIEPRHLSRAIPRMTKLTFKSHVFSNEWLTPTRKTKTLTTRSSSYGTQSQKGEHHYFTAQSSLSLPEISKQRNTWSRESSTLQQKQKLNPLSLSLSLSLFLSLFLFKLSTFSRLLSLWCSCLQLYACQKRTIILLWAVHISSMSATVPIYWGKAQLPSWSDQALL